MKNNTTLFRLTLTLFLTLSLLSGCKKSDENSDLPKVTTNIITMYGDTYIVGDGTVVSEGTSKIYARGFCWSTKHSPTVSDNKTGQAISSIGDYTYELSNLISKTTYYVRAYAMNNSGVGYGNEVAVTTLGPCPVVTNQPVTNITLTSATLSGAITSDAGSNITDRGICWSVKPCPTIADNKVSLGSGMGNITGNMTGLVENTIYYVRSYATNSVGTGYGAIIKFSTNVKDFDQNEYKVVVIGNQIWMAKNLNVTHFRNGEVIPNVTDSATWRNLTSSAYCNYKNDPVIASTYGRLYNWYIVNDSRKMCPEGWHVPSQQDFLTLYAYLGNSDSSVCRALKESGTAHWETPNTGANNRSGFTALPGGMNPFSGLREEAFWWTTTEHGSEGPYCLRILGTDYGSTFYDSFDFIYDDERFLGLSVRCIHD